MTLDYAPSAPVAATALADVMERLGLRMNFAKDEEIFCQDEEADLTYLVVSGAVRTTRLLSDGRRQVGSFYYPGDLVGLETGDIHRFSAEALSDSVLLVVKRSALKAFAGDEAVDRAIWEATRLELERTQEHLLVLGRKTACEKVASFLMDLAGREGAQRNAGDHISLPMGRQDMADYLGLTIETVSRMLTQLQGAAVVEFEGCRRFRVKRWDALERLAE
ncbi:helix-turn-helix domain-containing protein [Phenylobacterium sp.]|uniref:helix-turn-helix domain-containing protein n=1 Tax=Phenylobacterium sp. TaxID=1871053 RepID=UPI002730E7CA|nr:helix-turn-helix domain-containing protein [Phenylobacterium sp.]MDP1618714.1 helix-turn-helix domain-containing protein [Phenylobacterium sp.]MDP1986044.1 helix-turn-helix domain-containing protein [Phenylobacterium sp.]